MDVDTEVAVNKPSIMTDTVPLTITAQVAAVVPARAHDSIAVPLTA